MLAPRQFIYIDNNKWLDEKNKRLLEIKTKEEETDRLFASAKENEKKFVSLEEEVSKIPNLLLEEYEKGKKDKEKELAKDIKFEGICLFLNIRVLLIGKMIRLKVYLLK